MNVSGKQIQLAPKKNDGLLQEISGENHTTSNDLRGLRAGKYLSETTVLSSIGGYIPAKKLRWKEKNKPGLAGPGYAGGKEG